jgi:hypothetical protein
VHRFMQGKNKSISCSCHFYVDNYMYARCCCRGSWKTQGLNGQWVPEPRPAAAVHQKDKKKGKKCTTTELKDAANHRAAPPLQG